MARIDPLLVEDARSRIPVLAGGRRFGLVTPQSQPDLRVVR
jgi:hypothetical protein